MPHLPEEHKLEEGERSASRSTGQGGKVCISKQEVAGGEEKKIICRIVLCATGYRSNFNKQSLENTTYGFEYDYDSIMHYGRYFFR